MKAIGVLDDAKKDFLSASDSVLVEGATIALDAQRAIRAEMEIKGSRIAGISRPAASASAAPKTCGAPRTRIDLEGYILLPGLINAHDHLEFNLFPRLGRGTYNNAGEWARDIYHPNRPPVREHLSVPKVVRLWWGGLKNLLSGVTTACHHNPYEEGVFGREFPIRVVKRFGWAHSLEFANNFVTNYLGAPADAPFILHLGEGTDRKSHQEIYRLERFGALTPRTVIVHGVGLKADGHALRRLRGAALVWCPSSNRFTLGATVDAQEIRRDGKIALGSDSALTAEGDLLDEIRCALLQPGMEPRRIYSMVTDSAASILHLRDGEGVLRRGGVADFIALRPESAAPCMNVARADFTKVELVVVSGQPHLVSEQMRRRWPSEWTAGLECIEIDGTVRWVRAPVRWMLDETQSRLPDAIRLAGKRVSA